MWPWALLHWRDASSLDYVHVRLGATQEDLQELRDRWRIMVAPPAPAARRKARAASVG
jgi:hypothetical protein